MTIPTPKPNRPPAPPKPLSEAPMAGLTPTVVETEDGPKRALVVEGTEPLPPPGDARRDELARRGDGLAERLEAIEKELGLDSDGVQRRLMEQPIEREIADKIDHTAIVNPVEGRVYYWANESAAHGIDIKLHQQDGFKVVCGEDPENPEDRDVRGYRRIGDTILMWCPQSRWDEVVRRRAAARLALKGSVDSGLMDLAERAAHRGIHVTDLSPYQLKRAAKQAAAKQIASAITESRIRTGNIPGLRNR